MIWIYILIFLASCFILIKSGTWLVRALSRIAHILGWNEFLVTFFLVGFATSLPELFVGISSAFHKFPQLSFGNIIGANILNLTLGIGLTVLVVGGIKLKSKVVRKNSFYAAFFAFLPFILMLDKTVSRIDGIILLLALGLYAHRILGNKQKFSKIFLNHYKPGNTSKFKNFLKDLGLLFISFALLLLASEAIVRTMNFLAIEAKLPLVVAGALFVSLGTVLPEISFGIRAIMMGHKDMILGDFMGTIVINSTLILGLVSIISPFAIANFSPYLVGIIFTFLIVLSFAYFSRTDREISKKEACILISFYILFITAQILIS